MPSEVFVLGQRFGITTDTPDWCRDRNGRPLWLGDGCVDFRTGLIHIDPALQGDYARETLMHELTHAVDHMLIPAHSARGECPKPRPKRWRKRGKPVPIFLAEATVQAWSRGLFATMKDPRNLPVLVYLFMEEPR